MIGSSGKKGEHVLLCVTLFSVGVTLFSVVVTVLVSDDDDEDVTAVICVCAPSRASRIGVRGGVHMPRVIRVCPYVTCYVHM